MRTNARLKLLRDLRDLGVREYTSTEEGESFHVTFGPAPAPAAPEAEDEPEKLPPLPKDAMRLALALGDS